MSVEADFRYNGGIVLSITCNICCDNEISHIISDVDDLMYESLESKADTLMLKNKWERSCTCPDCVKERLNDS